MPKRRLPIGIQTFRQIREEGSYYVDKTTYARTTATTGWARRRCTTPSAFCNCSTGPRGRTIHLVGVEFSREERNLVTFDVEQD